MPIGRRKFIRGDFGFKIYLIVIIGILSISGLLFYFRNEIISVIAFAYNGFLNWAVSWHGVLSGLGSLLLSFLLVVLYWQQKKILKLHHQPRIHIDHFGGEQTLTGEKRFQVILSNLGGGSATNLAIYAEAEFLSDNRPRIDNSIIYLRDDVEDIQNRIERGAYIEAETLEKKFFAKGIWLIIGSWSEGPSERYVVGSGNLPEIADEDRIRLRLSIQYQTPMRKTEDEKFFDRVIPLKGGLDEIFRRSIKYDIYHDNRIDFDREDILFGEQ